MLSYAVSQRAHEISIRMVLRAQVTDVRRMVMLAGFRWLAIGISISMPASIGPARILVLESEAKFLIQWTFVWVGV